MNDVEQWIVRYFEHRADLNGRDPESLLDANYFELALLDSLGIVEMIIGLEEDLGVRLESQHMQDPRFCSIRGLAAIVDEQRG